jgi:hypothetical protein
MTPCIKDTTQVNNFILDPSEFCTSFDCGSPNSYGDEGSTSTVICTYCIYIYVHSVSEIPFAASQQSTYFASGGYSGLSVHSFTAVPKPRSSRKKVSADLSNSKKAWHLQIHPWLDGGEVVDKKPCTTGMAGITQAKGSGRVGPACKWPTK